MNHKKNGGFYEPIDFHGEKLKPLEARQVTINPDLVAGKTQGAWKERVSTPSLAEQIADLAETHFPTGKPVETQDHQDFRNAVSELISRERGS